MDDHDEADAGIPGVGWALGYRKWWPESDDSTEEKSDVAEAAGRTGPAPTAASLRRQGCVASSA